MYNKKMLDVRQYEKLLYVNREVSEELITNLLQEKRELCLALIEAYRLNLIYDIYVLKVNIETYNGYKRRRLRLEIVKLLELVDMAMYVIALSEGQSIECAELYTLIDVCETKFSNKGEK